MFLTWVDRIFVHFTICILLLNIHILPTHVKTHNRLHDFRELFLNSPKTTSTWRGFLGVHLYPQYIKKTENSKRQAFGEAVFSSFYPKEWPWWPPDFCLFYLPPPPTQNIGSAPANFFSSLALFLQQNKQSNNYWGEQDRGLRFIYNRGKLQWGITYTKIKCELK